MADEIRRDLWEERPPIEYVVDPLIGPKKVVTIAAYGSSMKSWLLLSLALDIASGAKWLGRFQCKKRRVLYLDYENDDDETSRRVRGLYKERVEGFDPIIMPSKYTSRPGFEADLMAWAQEYGVVCIDTYSAGTGNTDDENKTTFARALQIMKRVAAKTGCVFIVLHFTKKSRTNNDGDVIKSADRRQDLRGASQLYNAVDVIFHTESITDDTCSVYQTKHRGQKKYPEFTVAIEGGMAPAPVRLVVVDLVEQMRQKAKEALRKPFEAVKKVLEKYPEGLSGNELFEKTGGNRTTQLALFRNLEKHGFLTFFEKKYVLPVSSKKSGTGKVVPIR